METNKNKKTLVESYTVTIEEDPETGDIILPLTNEILESVGWKEGDVIDWIDNKDGSWSLIKVPRKTVK